MDFVRIAAKPTRNGMDIFPQFILKKSSDLMIRGGDFYAVWNEQTGLWSTDEQCVLDFIDKALEEKKAEMENSTGNHHYNIKYMWDASSGCVDSWHRYCQKQLRDKYHPLDEKIVFADTVVTKEDYVSKKLDYPLKPMDIPNYERIMSTLYDPEERHKLEWAIGSVVTGDSKWIQKFLVLYGSAGTGKSTVLNIIQQLFDGYYAIFDAKALGSSTNTFALEPFKTNPLVAIQHDGDLSHIEDNTRLNSLVSHEYMTVNEKYKSSYTNKFNALLLMGTNKPVQITDSKSGLLRRLIDVHPSGRKLESDEYDRCMKNIKFELPGIACHCRDVYLDNPNYYDKYVPTMMMDATNDFYNFMLDNYCEFKRADEVTLKKAWDMYKLYTEEANVKYPYPKRLFKEELKNYFDDFYENIESTSKRYLYVGFKTEKFEKDMKPSKKKEKTPIESWLKFEQHPLEECPLNIEAADCPAQYAVDDKPSMRWCKNTKTLKDIDTSKLHYVQVPKNLICIDFDIKDENGNKSFERNLEEASKWPETYAELSKSGGGIHLHYFYDGDPLELKPDYDKNIEVKVQIGDSSLRRKLTLFNLLPIATISSGLPKRSERKTINPNVAMNDKALHTFIKKNLQKKYHSSTKCSMDFIKKGLDDAYEAGIRYDVTDLKPEIITFASMSTNNSDYCKKIARNLKYQSEDIVMEVDVDDRPIVFYDCEVFPNLLVVNWKFIGKDNPVVRMINPSPEEVGELFKLKLVGFNCRRYDNHILYARYMGYTNEQLYQLSQDIIKSTKRTSRRILFNNAYNLSFTDIYDFASAGNKKSLKKLEIEMGFHHKELGLPWDQPVPEEKWELVAEYCDNDVLATEAAWHYLQSDWIARQILAEITGLTENDTTNTLTTKFIFGDNRSPQSEFCYRNLAEPVTELPDDVYEFLKKACPEMMAQRHGPNGESLLPYFPGYKYENGKSTYKGEEIGEGGLVRAKPGMHGDAALLDVASMHPHSAIAECLFGPRYTKAYMDVVEGRVSIKHESWNVVSQMFDGKLKKFIQQVLDGEITSGNLADALKTAINSVYGLTSAKFENPFRDPRNVDNIVAKRGALFMVDLKEEVEKRGFTVAHIKTDSIKIPDATPDIINFVMEFGRKYGYTFEHEATYDRMCLVNNAVYIAKYKDPEVCKDMYGYAPAKNTKAGKKGKYWTATGKQFAVPYIFKTLFSGEPITDDDVREVFSVKSALYLDMNGALPDVSEEEKALDKLESKYKKGDVEQNLYEEESKRLKELIEKGHDYHFVGRVGEFCPVKRGGGILCREQDGKFYAPSGTTGYRWLESETLMKNNGETYTVIDPDTGEEREVASSTIMSGLEDIIDTTYYDKLVQDAIDAISKHGDFKWFVSDEPYIPEKSKVYFMYMPKENEDCEELPFV